MEKSKPIFDVSLDSLLDTPIEVDGVGEGYVGDIIPSREDKREPAAKEKEVDEDDGSFELGANDNEEDSEEDVDEDQEEIQEELPSSSKNSPQKSKEGKSSSPLTPYAQLLIDEGVLPNLNIKEFDGTAEGLKDAMISEILGAVDMYKDSLPPRVRDLINNYEDGVSFEKLLELDRTSVTIETLDNNKVEDDTDLQKQLVTDYLKRTTKFNDKKIEKMVDSMEDSGELEDEAKSSLVELKAIIEKEKEHEKKAVQLQQKQMEEARRQELTALHEKIRTTQEIIPGIKVNDKVRQTVLTSMTQPVGYDQTGRPVNRIVAARMENPIEFEMKLHYLFELTKGFKDFSKLAEKGRKDASRQFEEAVEDLDRTIDGGIETKSPTLGNKSRDFLKGLEKTFKI